MGRKGKSGRKSKGSVRRHIAFRPDVDKSLNDKIAAKDRDRSWLVNYYVERGLEAERRPDVS